MTESLQRKSWKVLSTLVSLSGVSKEEIFLSSCQEENWTHTCLESCLMPYGALDGQEIAQGASSAPGTLAGMQQVQLRLLTCASGCFGHSR